MSDEHCQIGEVADSVSISDWVEMERQRGPSITLTVLQSNPIVEL